MLVDLELGFLHVIDELLRPNLGVAFVAAFEKHHDDRAFEPACDIARVHPLADFFCELREYFFGCNGADFVGDLRKVVGFDISEYVQTGCRFLGQPFGDALEELGAVKNSVVGSRFSAS